MTELHDRIKTARIELGLSQAELALAANVSQPTVANWESGSHIPRSSALQKISAALNVDKSWLLSGLQADAQPQPIEHTYLARPIHHVPIYHWPDLAPDFRNTPPIGYLPYPAERAGAFALIDYREQNNKNHIMIFDTDTNTDRPEGRYLCQKGKDLYIAESTEVQPKDTIIGRLKTDIQSY